jgi:serine/threonine-protein kinase
MTQRTHPTVERTLGIGDAIGHYRIVGVAGNGNLGRLYIAEQRKIPGVSKTVALRCIRPELAHSPHFRALFFDAASIAPRCEHPNVVTIHEMGEVDESYFISMEYLPGENIASILTRCNTSADVPPDIAAAVVKQAANAVQYLHDRRRATALPVGLGPGEVDASNVFLTYHGTVKLLSIGLGPIRVANASAASGEHKVGSSSQAGAYAAPEHSEGIADGRTDVFNLGLVLWKCLTGHGPLVEHSSGEIAVASLTQRLVAPRSVRADVPEALDAIAMRALSPDPLERFQSARAMSEALDRYLIRRDPRPTPKHMRRWLEQLFDAERASLQLQIAQGRDVEGALSLLAPPERVSGASSVANPRVSMRPRELWSTSHSVFSRLERRTIAPPGSYEPGRGSNERASDSSILVRRTPSLFTGEPALAVAQLTSASASGARPPRTWLVAATIATCAAIAIGTAVLLSSSDESSPFRDASRDSQLADRSGRVDVRSTPEGATVFVDGEPTGLRTPVVLKGLAAGRRLRLRVEKPGFASQERELEVVGGSVEPHAFELTASMGLVHFAGGPADARIYVDEALVDIEDEKRVNLSVGPHTVRVETTGSLIFSGTVVIVAGEQTIRVDGEQATP